MLEIYEINEGIRAYLLPADKFSVCCMSVLIKRRLSRDEVTMNALIPAVLRQGCEKYTGITDINRAADELDGGKVDIINMKKGGIQLMDFYFEVLDNGDNIKRAVDLTGEIMLRPLSENGGFKSEYVERAKTELKAAIKAMKDDKREYAKNRLISEMFSGESIGIYGDGYLEDIDRITPRKLFEHYRRIIGESEIYIIAVGSFDSKIKEYIRQFDIGGRKDSPGKESAAGSGKTGRIIEDMDVTQGKLCAGMRMDGDYFTLVCANEILGRSANSRLFTNIREKEGLCYYITTSVPRGMGAVILQAGISGKNLDKVMNLTAKELSEFRKVSDDEIKTAKDNIIKNYELTGDRPQSIMNLCLDGILWGGGYESGELVGSIKAVNNEDIRKTFADRGFETIYFLREAGNTDENS